MQKQYITINGLKLAYIDFGGSGAPMLALHGHFGRACVWAPLAAALKGCCRIIALEQRGHGVSDRPADYSREGYVSDAAEFIRKLGIAPAVVLGHSLGGVNAYQLAARHPDLVRGLIVEDIGAKHSDNVLFSRAWPRRFDSVQAAAKLFTANGVTDTYFLESLVEHDDGWGFRFDAEDMIRSSDALNGDWWGDWLGSTCPALLFHGGRSWVLSLEQAREMAARRPHTTLADFPNASHDVHGAEPEAYACAVRDFVSRL